MEGSNNDGSNSGGGGRRNLAYAEKFREQMASISREAQTLAEISRPYREEARAQIQRALPESQVPGYQRLIGVNREKLLAHGEGLIAAIAGCNGRGLEERQAQAVADSLVDNARSTALLEWALFGGTLALAYRHRRRIPAPVLARGGLLARFLWPPALFFMYSIPISLFVQPFVQVSNARLHSKKLQKDPRLQGLTVDLNQAMRLAAVERAKQAGIVQESPSRQEAESQTQSWGDYADKGDRSQSPTPSSAYQGWGDDSKNPPGPSPQQTHSGWDDDASPIAPSARGSASGTSLSAWDRIRNQSVASSSQSGYQSNTPSEQDSRNAKGGGWGTESSYDQGSSALKDQAQREFDQLLDRERQGQEQAQNSWNRK